LWTIAWRNDMCYWGLHGDMPPVYTLHNQLTPRNSENIIKSNDTVPLSFALPQPFQQNDQCCFLDQPKRRML
jgi:hypothetical protein